MKNYKAPKGQEWVCQACGRRGEDKTRLGDTSCFTWAVLCYKGMTQTVRRDEQPAA